MTPEKSAGDPSGIRKSIEFLLSCLREVVSVMHQAECAAILPAARHPELNESVTRLLAVAVELELGFLLIADC